MNEYHKKFEELQDQSKFKGQQWFGKRQELVKEYSWAVPNEQALCYLAEFDHLTEIGAGSGYWANCITEMGGTVRATDAQPPDDQYTPVEQAYVDDLDLSDKAVLTVWPPVGDAMAMMAVQDEPSHVLYVGEPRGGCTGSDGFFDLLDERYGLVAKVDIPSYVGVHDNLFHYVRKL